MGGRCDQENDRQKVGAAERRMNDFEYEEKKSRMEDVNQQRWKE